MTDNETFKMEDAVSGDGSIKTNKKSNKPTTISIRVENADENVQKVDENTQKAGGDANSKRKKHRSTIKRIFSRRAKGSDDDSEHSFGDFLMSPTHPSHLGIFKFMPFEYNGLDDKHHHHHHHDHDSDTPLSTKEKLKHILHSQALHLIIIVLVLVDSVLVVIELLFDLGVIGPSDGEHVAREISHGFSIGILSMFMIELVLKLWVDHRHFIRHKIEVLDALVVTVSWVVDIVLVFVDSVALVATELLLLLRLWRVFRIVNGIIVAVKTKADEKVHFLKDKVIELHEQLAEAEEEVDALKRDVRALKAKLREHGIKMKDHRI